MVGKKDTSLAQFAKGSKLQITSRARLNPLRDVGEERHFPGAVCEGQQTADNKQSEVEPLLVCGVGLLVCDARQGSMKRRA
jgi:hypothetical protein